MIRWAERAIAAILGGLFLLGLPSCLKDTENSSDILALAFLLANSGPVCTLHAATFDKPHSFLISDARDIVETVQREVPETETVKKYVRVNGNWTLLTLRRSGAHYFLGDMLFAESEVMDIPSGEGLAYSLAFNDSSLRWPMSGGYIRVPYVIDGGVPVATRNEIASAMAHWEDYSIVRFSPRTSEPGYIQFQDPGDGSCSANVGYLESARLVRLAEECGTGNAVHEIGHSLGLMHTQQRNDRDSHVLYYPDRTTAPSQYQKLGSAGLDIGRYDITSIMHYGSYFFPSGSLPVMTKLDGSLIAANRSALTTCDTYTVEQIHTNPSFNNKL